PPVHPGIPLPPGGRDWDHLIGLSLHVAIQLSLSRLNHWLPRGQTHPEVVEGTTEFHHEITDALLPQADAVFDDATTFHATVDVLDPQPTLVERLICHLLLQCQLLAPGFLRGHEDLHVGH